MASYFPWDDLLPELQKEVVHNEGNMDPYTQQSLAMTSRANSQVWKRQKVLPTLDSHISIRDSMELFQNIARYAEGSCLEYNWKRCGQFTQNKINFFEGLCRRRDALVLVPGFVYVVMQNMYSEDLLPYIWQAIYHANNPELLRKIGSDLGKHPWNPDPSSAILANMFDLFWPPCDQTPPCLEWLLDLIDGYSPGRLRKLHSTMSPNQLIKNLKQTAHLPILLKVCELRPKFQQYLFCEDGARELQDFALRPIYWASINESPSPERWIVCLERIRLLKSSPLAPILTPDFTVETQMRLRWSLDFWCKCKSTPQNNAWHDLIQEIYPVLAAEYENIREQNVFI